MLEPVSDFLYYAKSFLPSTFEQVLVNNNPLFNPAALSSLSSAVSSVAASASSVAASAAATATTTARAIPALTPTTTTTANAALDLSHPTSLNLHFPDLGSTSITEILLKALAIFQPAIDYIVTHPWVLLPLLTPLLIPLLDSWVLLIGFTESGIAAESLAAIIQSRIGNVPKNSIFSWLQKNGARGFAARAVRTGTVGLSLAVALATIGAVLIEKNVTLSVVEEGLSKVWEGSKLGGGGGEKSTATAAAAAAGTGIGAGMMDLMEMAAGVVGWGGV